MVRLQSICAASKETIMNNILRPFVVQIIPKTLTTNTQVEVLAGPFVTHREAFRWGRKNAKKVDWGVENRFITRPDHCAPFEPERPSFFWRLMRVQ